MRGERRGEPADLAPAHRVRLAGDREGRGARLADASRRQMEIEDRVDLVGAGGDRKSVVYGRVVSVRVGIGGRRVFEQTNATTQSGKGETIGIYDDNSKN